jgi:hypothetical protein
MARDHLQTVERVNGRREGPGVGNELGLCVRRGAEATHLIVLDMLDRISGHMEQRWILDARRLDISYMPHYSASGSPLSVANSAIISSKLVYLTPAAFCCSM